MTLGYAQDLQERLGIDVTLVDIDDTAAVRRRPERPRPASMLWVETPTNPMLEVADLPALVEAGARGRARSSASTTRSRRRWCSARSSTARTSSCTR